VYHRWMETPAILWRLPCVPTPDAFGMSTIVPSAWSSTDLASYHDLGFVVKPGFFTIPEMAALQAEQLAGWNGSPEAQSEPYLRPAHAAMIVDPRLVAVARQICGERCRFHHLNTYVHGEGAPGVPWHNDYEQAVHPMPRRHQNLICLIYPGGLDGTVGDLVVMPGTQQRICEWNACHFLGTAVLPGEIVIDRLPPGTVIFAHTGLLHCRRAKPGAGPRFFCDISFVEGGIAWPATVQHDWRAMYAACRHLDRDGSLAHLFDEADLLDPAELTAAGMALDQTAFYRRLLAP
jgi:hypothetical protein